MDMEPVETSRQYIASLDGRPWAGFRLRLKLGPTSPFGAQYFQLYLQDGEDRLSLAPLLVGLYNQGIYPSHNWVEVVSTSSGVTLAAPGVGEWRPSLAQWRSLFRMLAA